jgi:hypothetical protein
LKTVTALRADNGDYTSAVTSKTAQTIRTPGALDKGYYRELLAVTFNSVFTSTSLAN